MHLTTNYNKHPVYCYPMGQQLQDVLTTEDLNATDRKVLDVLHDGRVTPQYVAEEIEVSRTYASERLKRLKEHRHVRKLASGLYELVEDPREGTDPTPGREPPAEREESIEDLRDQLDQLESEAAKLRDEKARLREELQSAQDVDVERVRSGVDAALVALEGQQPNVDAAQNELEGILDEINGSDIVLDRSGE